MAEISEMAGTFNKLSAPNSITKLSPKILGILNEGIKHELTAAQLYLHMSMWCDYKSYTGTAKYMYSHYAEEKEHMHKIYKYILDKDELPTTPASMSHTETFKDIKDVITKALAHEKLVTAFYTSSLKEVLSENDQMTFDFLQWFVEEQLDEEIGFKNFLDRLEIIGNDKRGQYFLDKEIGQTVE